MIRPISALTALALTLGASVAQEAAPDASAEVVVDPAATVNASSKQANMLTGFYATQAVIELCAIPLDPAIAEGMGADRTRLESALAMDTASAELAYAKVKADVESTSPDCTEGSADRAGVDAVTAIYADVVAPPAADAAATPTPAQ